jgi:hypothetical protein
MLIAHTSVLDEHGEESSAYAHTSVLDEHGEESGDYST